MSTAELADRITTHPDTVRRWVRNGSITPTSVTRTGATTGTSTTCDARSTRVAAHDVEKARSVIAAGL